MLTICTINPNYYRSSGVTTAVKRLYDGLGKLGFDQYFVNCHYGVQSDDLSWIPDDRYAEFKLMSANPAQVFLELHRLRKWLKSKSVDIVQVHHRRLAAILTFGESIPASRLVYTAQVTYSPNPIWKRISLRHTVATSQSVARNMQQTMPAETAITVIHNPAEFARKLPVWDEPRHRAICIGRLEPIKGHNTLIDAWARLAAEGFTQKLTIIGEGYLRSELEEKSARLGLSGLIEFKGYLSNVEAEVEESDFAILVSAREGYPLVVTECAARGRASLLTDVDGSRDCLPPVRNLPNGVPFGNVSALTDALRTWLRSPALVRQEGELFYDFLRAETSIAVVASKYARLYTECCQNHCLPEKSCAY